MVRTKDITVQGREQIRWLVIEAIQERLLFYYPKKSIVLKPPTHLKNIDIGDVHSIINELSGVEKIITIQIVNTDAFTTYKGVSVGNNTKPYNNIENIHITASEGFADFYEKEKAKKDLFLKKKSSQVKSSEKRERDNLIDIIFAMAVDKYGFDAENPSKHSGSGKEIYDAMVRLKIHKPLKPQSIMRKIREGAGVLDTLEEEN